MVAQMEGPAAAKSYVSDYLAADMPTRLMNYRNTLLVDDSILPNPVKYLTYEPFVLDNWPTIITLVESTRNMERVDFTANHDPIYDVTYGMRTYAWVRAVGPDTVTLARDHMTTVVREALLDGPALRIAGSSPINPVGVNSECKINEGTITEDFSDLTTLKGERFLAASYLSYELNLYETVVRANLGVMLSSDINVALIEKVPNAPTFLQASGGDTDVSLTWRAPTWDGGGIHVITGYIIQVSTDSGTTWVTIVADTTSTNPYHVVPSLANGTSYQFRVAAFHAAGTGAYSSASQNVIPSA